MLWQNLESGARTSGCRVFTTISKSARDEHRFRPTGRIFSTGLCPALVLWKKHNIEKHIYILCSPRACFDLFVLHPSCCRLPACDRRTLSYRTLSYRTLSCRTLSCHTAIGRTYLQLFTRTMHSRRETVLDTSSGKICEPTAVVLDYKFLSGMCMSRSQAMPSRELVPFG